jgi:hypothetical protein
LEIGRSRRVPNQGCTVSWGWQPLCFARNFYAHPLLLSLDPLWKSPQVTYTTPNKSVWKLPTSTQLRATWHTDSLDVVVLPVSSYHNCCIDGGIIQEYFRLLLTLRWSVMSLYSCLGGWIMTVTLIWYNFTFATAIGIKSANIIWKAAWPFTPQVPENID